MKNVGQGLFETLLGIKWSHLMVQDDLKQIFVSETRDVYCKPWRKVMVRWPSPRHAARTKRAFYE